MAVYWNDALNEEFRVQRLEKKTPVEEMAAFFGTSVAAIYAHARVINALIQPHQGWTEEAIAQLRAGVAAGDTDKELIARTGRLLESVRWKLADLELTGLRQTRWDAAAYDHLRQMAAEGKTTAEMAEIRGVSVAVIRERLKMIDVKAARAPRPKATPRARVAGKPGRPAREKVIVPLTAEQVALVTAMIGNEPIRKIARAVRLSDRTLKERAAAAGVVLDVSMRRHGAELTRELLEDLVGRNLTATQAGKLVARDRRTLKEAAAAYGLVFATRETLAAAARQAKADINLVRQAQEHQAKADRQVARQKVADQKAAVRQAAAGPARAAKVTDSQVKANSKAVLRPLVSQKPARKPPVRQAKAVPRVAAQAPVKVRVLAAPAPLRAATVPADQKPDRRPFAWSFVPSAPRVVFDQKEVDAAVARFIAERGVTRAADVDPAEAAVTAARRLGFVVLRDGDGFTLDGRIRLAGVKELQAFVAKREDAKREASLAMSV